MGIFSTWQSKAKAKRVRNLINEFGYIPTHAELTTKRQREREYIRTHDWQGNPRKKVKP